MKPEDKAVVQQALAVMQRIESADGGGGFLNASQADQLEDAITALRQLLEQPAAWVGLEKADMPDGDNPMYDHDYFIKGMVWADIKLREKNGGAA